MICAIVISLYIFFRHGCRKKRQIIDPNLGARSSLTSADTSNTAATNEKSVDNLPLKSQRIISSSNKQASNVKYIVDPNKHAVNNLQEDF
jgi:hypothetical protein